MPSSTRASGSCATSASKISAWTSPSISWLLVKETNFRSQVQLKARSNLMPNQDGSFSVSVPVSNLNYLLNGPTPLYVLYRPETNGLFVSYARDELRRIELANPTWKTQGDVTIRFIERLDPASLERIRDRVLREAHANRKLQDIATSLTPGARIQVDATTLEPRSPLQVEKLLLESGMTAVANGFGQGDRALLDARTETVRGAAEAPSIRGYAEFSNSRYLQADAPLREALIASTRLSAEDRHFLQFLIDAVDLSLGHTSNEVFRERSARWRAGAPPTLAVQYDVLYHWMLRAEAKSEAEKQAQDLPLREAIGRMGRIPDAPSSLVQYANALLLVTDAQNWCLRFVDVLAMSRDPRLWTSRFREPPSVVIGRELKFVAEWQAKMATVMSKTAAVGNIPRYCEIQYSRDLCDEMSFGYFHLASSMFERPSQTSPTV